MKIYTRGGDTGETSLLAGGRVPKYHLRVEAYGTLDELNSWIGHVRSINADEELEKALAWLQPKLHLLCSDVAAPYDPDQKTMTPRLQPGEEVTLEREIDLMEKDLPELTHFILPGGGPVGSALHLARTVCRRAERRLVELSAVENKVNPAAIRFTNRLGDYLFVLARWANRRGGFEETIWEGRE